MADPQISPISQLLHTLGITREDLSKRSDQMRQFLTADDVLSIRVQDREVTSRPRSGSDLHSSSRSTGSSRSLARSLSRTSSSSHHEVSPPTTPVKSEPHESQIPHRRMDSMEMVLERQRRQRRSRKDRERDSSRNMPLPPSPSPSNASQSGQSLDSFMQSRDEPQTSSAATSESGFNGPSETTFAEHPPVTPQKNKYYRDHTNLSAQALPAKGVIVKTETLTPTRPIAQALPQSLPQTQYYAYPAYVGYSHYLPVAYRPTQASTSATPITPQPQRIQPPLRKKTASPLPPSSPPASSPMSSPTRRVVNLVSSPGPMGPEPEETEYDNLPYKLPPGPYSPNKPDLSYAALVGRAILSSPEHRLTLQEIYDWITIVYPHYKRGETTWMNSIRHVLSTTVVFRKVPRDRSVGRTLWAIYEEDLECFKDGGFKKQLCKDYVNGDGGKDKAGTKGKTKARKRGDDDDVPERRSKRARKDQPVASSSMSGSSVVHSSFLGQVPLGSHPLFPSSRPTPHLQPYYTAPAPQGYPSVPTDVIFPPLPAAASFNRIVNSSISAYVKVDDAVAVEANISTPSSSQSRSSPAPATLSSVSSSSSIPELTPNRTSTSPPSSLPASSDVDIDMHDDRTTSGPYRPVTSTIIADPMDEQEQKSSVSVEDDDSIFNTTLLGPVRFWGVSPKASGALQPGIELLNFENNSDDGATSLAQHKKGKKKEVARNLKSSAFPPMSTSPTLNVRAIKRKSSNAGRPTTPVSSLPPPSTPPRSTERQHQISSIRTPLSHKGLHMSPTASLAHYKSNLDPPPTFNSGGVVPLDTTEDEVDPMRTPRKRSTGNAVSVFGQPVTPRKLVFSAGPGDSPFRTPGGLSASPFRTPRSRAIFDPHDPRTLLDEELNGMARYEDSPAGLFGKERSSLLYDSPGLDVAPKWW